jgi:hypothetical protein
MVKRARSRKCTESLPDPIFSIPSRFIPALSLTPFSEFFQHTARGRQARKPFGRGWMTVEKWNQVKDDVTQWSESHVREKMKQPAPKESKSK